MADLRPPLLDEYGLAAALGWHAEEFSRRTGVQVRGGERPQPGRPKACGPEAAVALFRIAQEALNNVLKHAKAKSVRIEVSATDEELILDVEDDGQGFDLASARRGRWGMTTMRERAEAAGGQLHIDAAPARARASTPGCRSRWVRADHADPHPDRRRPRRRGRRAEAPGRGRADMEVVACVGDGREAVQQARDAQPDVVLMDLSMPELNGADATRAILQRDPKCRVIVLSMYAQREYVRRALKAAPPATWSSARRRRKWWRRSARCTPGSATLAARGRRGAGGLQRRQAGRSARPPLGARARGAAAPRRGPHRRRDRRSGCRFRRRRWRPTAPGWWRSWGSATWPAWCASRSSGVWSLWTDVRPRLTPAVLPSRLTVPCRAVYDGALKSILVVEEHDEMRAALRDWLLVSLPPSHLREARSLEEALVQAGRRRARPGADEPRAPRTQRHRGDARLRLCPSCPVVIMSVNDSEALRGAALGAGAAAFVSKRERRTACCRSSGAIRC